MKKNLATVIILAFTILNLVMNCIIVFTLVPANKKVNTLITQIASAIDLDLTDDAASDYASTDTSDVALTDIETYSVADGETQTITLKAGEDGEKHYAVIAYALNINTTSEAYGTYGGADSVSTYESTILSTLNSVIGSYTIDEFDADQSGVKDACKEAMNALFDSNDYIVSVEFSSVVTQ